MLRNFTIKLALLALVGCADIDSDIPTEVTDDFIKDIPLNGSNQSFNVILNGVLSAMYSDYLYSDSFIQLDALTDNAYPLSLNSKLRNIADFKHTPNDDYIAGYWSANYKGVQLANNGVEVLTGLEGREREIAQIKFLRNLYYLNLVRVFGAIPYYTSNPNTGTTAVAKTPTKDIYNAMITELQAIIGEGNLPTGKFVKNGQPTLSAAYALLARIALYAVDSQDTVDEKDDLYDIVIDAASNVTASLTTNVRLDEIFSTKRELDDEILFTVRYNGARPASSETFSTVDAVTTTDEKGIIMRTTSGNSDILKLVPLENFVSIYEDTDSRKDYFILEPNQTFKILQNDYIFNNSNSKYGVRKYLSRQSLGDVGKQDFILFRYADVLLMRAEAYLKKSTPDLSAAQADLVSVHDRADSTTPLTSFTFEDLKLERRKELAFEGLHYFDLLRWGTLEAALQKDASETLLINNVQTTFTSRATNYNQTKLLWPIPADVIINSRGLIEQNPGY